jgi:uridine kinase
MNLTLVATLWTTNLELLVNDTSTMLTLARSFHDDTTAFDALQTHIPRTKHNQPTNRPQQNTKSHTIQNATACLPGEIANQTTYDNPDKYHHSAKWSKFTNIKNEKEIIPSVL